MKVLDDGQGSSISRSFFWCMKLPSAPDELRVMSQVDDPIQKLNVGDYVELKNPEHILWEVFSTDKDETVLVPRYLSMGGSVVDVDYVQIKYKTEELIPMVIVQIIKESEEQ